MITNMPDRIDIESFRLANHVQNMSRNYGHFLSGTFLKLNRMVATRLIVIKKRQRNHAVCNQNQRRERKTKHILSKPDQILCISTWELKTHSGLDLHKLHAHRKYEVEYVRAGRKMAYITKGTIKITIRP